jgi:SAM-dependent methyltransferase
MDFSRRFPGRELMDDPDASPDDLLACFRDLARVNRATLGYRPTLSFLERAARSRAPHRPLHILDVGCGYGDHLREIARWADRSRLHVNLTGVDLNPQAISSARKASEGLFSISWVTANAFTYEPNHEVDLVLSSLFTHHLDDAEIVRFLRWMERTAGLGWFINDLHRHAIPYHSFRLLSRAFRWHHFVQNDGPISIARAFAHEDWRRLVDAAHLDRGTVRVDWWAPFRLCVERLRPRP